MLCCERALRDDPVQNSTRCEHVMNQRSFLATQYEHTTQTVTIARSCRQNPYERERIQKWTCAVANFAFHLRTLLCTSRTGLCVAETYL